MAKKKYEFITDLYAEAVQEIKSSSENWMFFLRSACRNFRLPFDEQVLIYAQRPEASTVLPMRTWNEKEMKIITCVAPEMGKREKLIDLLIM